MANLHAVNIDPVFVPIFLCVTPQAEGKLFSRGFRRQLKLMPEPGITFENWGNWTAVQVAKQQIQGLSPVRVLPILFQMVAAPVSAFMLRGAVVRVRPHINTPPGNLDARSGCGEGESCLPAFGQLKHAATEFVVQAGAEDRSARHGKFPVEKLIVERDLSTLDINPLSLDTTQRRGPESAY